MHVLIVDISSVFWTIALAGAHADGNLPRDFTLKDIASCGQYDRVVIAVDGDDRQDDWPQIPWRRSIWPTYKKDREERAQHLWLALKDTIANCEAAGYIVMRAPPKEEANAEDDGKTSVKIGQYEADDVIGTVVGWARKAGHSCDIRSNDSDLAQLVRDDEPQVRLLRKIKGQKIVVDTTAVTEWLGVPPKLVASLKAIAGDTSDGYGGKNSPYPGIGKETAMELLKKANWKALDAIQAAIFSDEKTADGKVPKHIKVCKEHGLSAVEKGLKLARVAYELPIDCSMIEEAPKTTTQAPSLPIPEGGEVSDEEFQTIQNKLITERDSSNNEGQSRALALVEPPRMLWAPVELVARDRELYALITRALSFGPPDGKNDYGLIPGCGNKPALFDVGAERLAKVFGIYPRFKVLKEVIQLFGEHQIVLFIVRCRVYKVGADNQVGEAIAACNSNEKTFKRKEGAAPICDLVHSVFARAQKRAWVKGVLRATGAQKYFSTGFDNLDEAEFGEWPSAPQWVQREH